jgi:CRISPR-associated exonuclease Cas4
MVDSLPLSALQHLLFCERQCALIHLERLWEENRFTAEGRVLHEKVDEGRGESRPGIRITRSLQLRSEVLGLHGVADVVELHLRPDGRWQPFPVEYKRGKPKVHDADLVQLCAQAVCLEECFATPVPEGALFYGQTRRRLDVVFDEGLRDLTRRTAARLHELIASGVTPRAVREKKCEACSLLEVCLPGAMSRPRGAAAWNAREFAEILTQSPERQES